ncbi:hypothetical protein GCM10022419_118400 [Nonomuraea rosea]|uniref:Uncharacterized protein n=1 Tax=Nonomuraea rosea TaxID=638574 RepID=A0ABP6ZPL6_9ACTN
MPRRPPSCGLLAFNDVCATARRAGAAERAAADGTGAVRRTALTVTQTIAPRIGRTAPAGHRGACDTGAPPLNLPRRGQAGLDVGWETAARGGTRRREMTAPASSPERPRHRDQLTRKKRIIS